MKALVTGAGGFLGRYVTEQLMLASAEVCGFSRRRDASLASQGVRWFEGDIRDVEAVKRACAGQDVVFHTAAIAGIWGRWKDYYSTNTVGTRNILSACRHAGVRRLVYTSSPSVTFDGTEQSGVDERAPYARRWLCHYPHSKALAEQEVLASNGRHDLLTCSLRPHLIWGPGDPHLIPRLLHRARTGRLRQIGAGTNLIDTIYVENAASAHLAAASALTEGSPVAGRAYFISQGEPVNCWAWINQILQLAHLPAVDRSISIGTAWRVGALMELAYRMCGAKSEPPMTRFLAAQLGHSHHFDISAARRDWGYEPSISTDEGMRRLANSWVNR